MMQGYVLTSEIDGTIQMKSYLTGNPEIRLALNDDLYIGRGSVPNYGILIVNLFANTTVDFIFKSHLISHIYVIQFSQYNPFLAVNLPYVCKSQPSCVVCCESL